MWNFIDNPKKTKYILFHAIISAFLIDIRLFGLLVPAISVGIITIQNILRVKKNRVYKQVTIYTIVLMIFIYSLWPVLWPNPKLFFNAFIKMASYPSGNINLFLGTTSYSQTNPWYYIPLWIGVNTPIIILCLYLFGLIYSIKKLIHIEDAIKNTKEFFILTLTVIPIDLWLLFIILKPTLYDGWRHLYFIAPLLIIGSLFGIKYLLILIKNRTLLITFKLAITISVLAMAINLVLLHPYQQVYMNCLVSKKPESIRTNWEMDYWGLSYKEGFEKLLSIDSSATIKVKAANISAIDNWKLVNEADSRIILVDSIEDADYFISNYRFHPEEYPYQRIFSINKQGSRILSIYKIHK